MNNKYENLELYKNVFVEFYNKQGKKLALTTQRPNKHPWLLIENSQSTYDIVGTIKDPAKLVSWLKGEDYEEI